MNEIVDGIIKEKQRIEMECPDCVFLVFWDFDGTIFKGDCSEGYATDDLQYSGLVEKFILDGYSNLSSSQRGVSQYLETYRKLDETKGHTVAYVYLPTLFAGQREADMVLRSEQYFDREYHRYYFHDSYHAIQKFEKNGIQNFIISASADFFVKGAASSLGLDPSRFRGIRMQTKNGILTEQPVLPVSYAEGKEAIMKEIIGRFDKTAVLGAFGNSYHTDGNFLRAASKNYNAVSVMINGSKPVPEKYENSFTEIQLNRTVD